MFRLILLVWFTGNLLISAQVIPYSYASGRDADAVNRRYEAFQAAKGRNASQEELFGICGRVDGSTSQCNTKVGRPKDHETRACDAFCCLAGHKVGNCGSEYGFKPDWFKVISGIIAAGPVGGLGGLRVDLAANCQCSDDWRDVRCGPDGSFKGIRCPFDKSACWRKCCRQGKSGGRCGGTFKTKCKCD